MGERIPKTYSYLRVSTDQQDIEKDKFEVLNLAREKGFGEVKFFEDVITGKTPWKKRKIKFVIDDLQKRDSLIVPELSRLGRSMLEVMEILSLCTEKGIEVYSVRDRWELNSSLQSKVVATVFAMAAEIERDLLSARVKEALRAKREKGFHFGWPKGKPRGSKLDKYRIDIWALFLIGWSRKSIAKRFAVTWHGVNAWLKSRMIEPSEEELVRQKMEQYREIAASGQKPKINDWEFINPEEGSVSEVPDVYVNLMRDAALNARLDMLLDNTDQSEAYNKVFADKMRGYINQYDYDNIFKLLGINVK